MAQLSSTNINGNLNVMYLLNIMEQLQLNNGTLFDVSEDTFTYKGSKVITEAGGLSTVVPISVQSAVQLKNPRTINGVSFDGTSNILINTNQILTRGNYLIGNNFNGSTATTWSVDATSVNNANKVVARDSSGNFSANVITASLNGNASSSNKLAISRMFNFVGDVTGRVAFDGSSNVQVQLSHADTSSQPSITTTIPNMIQNVSLDSKGHVTGMTSYNLDNRYYTESEVNNLLSKKLDLTGGNLTGKLRTGNLKSEYTWTNSDIETNSIEIRNQNNPNHSLFPTLVMHQYGLGGMQMTMDSVHKILHFGSAFDNSSGKMPTFDGKYLTDIKINNNYIYHEGRKPTPNEIGAYTKTEVDNKTTLKSSGKVTAIPESDNNTRLPNGLSFVEAYSNGYPETYGNVLRLGGTGNSELFLGWSGSSTSSTGNHANNYIRNKRDTSNAKWSPWAKIWTSANFNPNNYLPNPGYGGVHELGRYLDLHLSGSSSDYDNRIEVLDDKSLRFSSSNGGIEVGPKNTHHCHIYTDRSSFYLNKDVLVNGAPLIPRYTYTFNVDGDPNKYYPVSMVINTWPVRNIKLYRGYSETAPNTWNTPTHKGGLMIDMRLCLVGWGGQQYHITGHMHQTYSKVLGDIICPGPATDTLVFLLRGGGAVYHIESDFPLTPKVTLGRFDNSRNSGGQVYEGHVDPITTPAPNFNMIDFQYNFSTHKNMVFPDLRSLGASMATGSFLNITNSGNHVITGDNRAHRYIADNNYGYMCKKTDGTELYSLLIGTDNKLHVGWANQIPLILDSTTVDINGIPNAFRWDGSYMRVGGDKYIMSNHPDRGWFPCSPGTGSSSTSYLGNSSWWYREAWSNSFRGGSINVTGDIRGARVFNAVWNDYAEYFPKKKNYITEPGDIIALSETENDEIYELATDKHNTIVGVHSDCYGHLIGGEQPPEDIEYEEYNKNKFIPIGLSGRLSVKFKGIAKKGMKVVPSEIPGVGREFDKSKDEYDKVIGFLVENNNNTEIKRVKMKIGK